MEELAKDEIEQLSAQSVKLESQLKILLLPKDPLDERNIMLEVSKSPFEAMAVCVYVIRHSCLLTLLQKVILKDTFASIDIALSE